MRNKYTHSNGKDNDEDYDNDGKCALWNQIKNITNAGNHPNKFASVAKLNCVCCCRMDFDYMNHMVWLEKEKNVNEKLSFFAASHLRCHFTWHTLSLIFDVH